MFRLWNANRLLPMYVTIFLLFLILSGCRTSPPVPEDPFLHTGIDAQNAVSSLDNGVCILPERSGFQLYSAYIPGENGPITLTYKDESTKSTITIVQYPGSDYLQITDDSQNVVKKDELCLRGKCVNVLFSNEGDIQKASFSMKSKSGPIFVQIKRGGNIGMDYVKHIVEQLVYNHSDTLCATALSHP